MDPKCSNRCPCESEAVGELAQGKERGNVTTEADPGVMRPCYDWQGMPTANRKGKRQRMDSPLESLQGCGPAHTFISDVWPPAL